MITSIILVMFPGFDNIQLQPTFKGRRGQNKTLQNRKCTLRMRHSYYQPTAIFLLFDIFEFILCSSFMKHRKQSISSSNSLIEFHRSQKTLWHFFKWSQNMLAIYA